MITERGVAEAIRDGLIPSPQNFYNAIFVAIRITGTGAVWRDQHEEYAWRDPAIWLTPEMAARWQGAPVIVQHPDAGILDSAEFAKRIIGSIVLPYIAGEELWCIARLVDTEAADLIVAGGADTSPAVVFSADESGIKITLPSGEIIFAEGEPVLCDHLAIVPRGVWSKGGTPNGVDNSAIERVAA